MTASPGSPTTSQIEFSESNRRACCPDLWQTLWERHRVKFSGRLFSLYMQLMLEVYIHLIQIYFNSVFHNSWHFILVKDHHFILKMWKVRIIVERMINFSFYLFCITFPVVQKFTYTQLVFGNIAFKLGPNVSGSLPQASHNKLGEFWPIPPDRAGVNESSLWVSLLTHLEDPFATKL